MNTNSVNKDTCLAEIYAPYPSIWVTSQSSCLTSIKDGCDGQAHSQHQTFQIQNVSLRSFASGRRPAMTPLQHCCRWRMLQSDGAVITCLVIGLLSLHVSADQCLAFDLHNEPCTYWPDQDWDAPCQCNGSCLQTSGAIYWKAEVSYKSNGFRDMVYNRPTGQSSLWPCSSCKTCSSYPNHY
jgi:hypothetical protein